MPQPLARENAPRATSHTARSARTSSGGSPPVAIWQVTWACDQACIPCRSAPEPVRDSAEISLNDGHRLLEKLRRLGPGRIILTGGDPFKRPDLFELTRFAAEIGLLPELHPCATPLLKADAIHQARDAGITCLTLSVDGPAPASHDARRGVPGSFHRTRVAAEETVRSGLELHLVSRVRAGNLDQMQGMARLAGEVGASTWTAAFALTGWDEARETEDSAERVERSLRSLYRLSLDAPFRITTIDAPQYGRVVAQEMSAWSGTGLDSVVVHSGSGDEADPMAVTDHRNTLFISHRGDLFPARNLPVNLGSTMFREVTELCDESELLTALRDPDRLTGRCGSCAFRGYCGGSRARAYATSGDALAEDPLCPYVPPDLDH